MALEPLQPNYVQKDGQGRDISKAMDGHIAAATLAALDTSPAPSGSNAFVTDLGAAGFQAATYTWNTDGTVATQLIGGITTTYAYNSDGTIHTATASSGQIQTYSYDASSNVTGVVIS